MRTGGDPVSNDIDLTYAIVQSAVFGKDIVLNVSGVVLPKGLYNKGKTALRIKSGRIVFESVSEVRITTAARTFCELGGSPHTRKPRILYKSEYDSFWEELCDAELFDIKKNDKYHVYIHSESAQEIFDIEFRSGDMQVMPDEAESIKITLKERAAALTEQLPVLALALGHKDTPAVAKLLTGLAVAYALSPIDLIPDFIPVLGYLDDVIVLPGLISLAMRIIPPEIMDECREKAVNMRKTGESKWFYAIPVVIIWIIILMVIIGVAIRS